MRRWPWISWRWGRRAVQLALLVLFLFLFRRTEYTGADQLSGTEHLFFHLDPLAVLAPMLGAREFVPPLWPALAVVGLTIVLGRFFCGWVCPLGTLLDIFDRVLRPIVRRTNRFQGAAFQKNTRYVILIAVLLAGALSFPLVGFVQPFAILMRGLTFWGDAVFYHGAEGVLNWLGDGSTAQTVATFVRERLLPFRPMVFHLAGVAAAMLAAIFLLEFIARRFWCRYLCPSGALLGLLASRPLLKRTPRGVCKSCGLCATDCRMNALDPVSGLAPRDCTLCMDCAADWSKGIARFRFKLGSQNQPRPVDLSRRGVLAGIAAGAVIPGAALAARAGRPASVPPQLLRPPGADGDEKAFLNLCIRCGECMKVCPTNVLQPAIFESGVEGLFSPRLVPRLLFEQSYCEYSCTLCGQVCPTGALPRLTEEQKHRRPIGKAYFDHSRCLPWAENTPCIRCEEMCPTPDKAIKILNTFTVKGPNGEDLEIQQPYIDRDLCVGCGICESNCPIDGPSAVQVWRVDAPGPKTEFLLKSGQLPVTPKSPSDRPRAS